ncbi:MAG: hypothetical protein HPY45_00800 [Anaerolineae bacterium]|nr:hypothetical protein [Anaerolineae bacterium]
MSDATAKVLGIISLVAGVFGFCGFGGCGIFGSLPFGLVAATTGLIAFFNLRAVEEEGILAEKVMAIVGMVLGIVLVLLSIILLITVGAFFGLGLLSQYLPQ